MTAAEPVAGRQQIEVALAALHELAMELLVERLELIERIDQEVIRGAVVASDVTTAAQCEVDVGEARVEDRVFERVERTTHACLPRRSTPRSRGPRAPGSTRAR